MDKDLLNQTTTISSRRKTFTVPLPPPGPCNQTYIASGLGDLSGISTEVAESVGNSILKASVLEASSDDDIDRDVIPNKSAIPADIISHESHRTGMKKEGYEDLFGDNYFEDEKQWLHKLISKRNSRYPEFIIGDANVSSTSTPMFECSTVVQQDCKSKTDFELERLQSYEKTLLGEIKTLEDSINLHNTITKSELAKCTKKRAELQKGIERKIKARKDIRKQIQSVKEETINIKLKTKDKINLIDFPHKLMKTFLGVSDDGTCQDPEFCKDFGAGKCPGLPKTDNDTSKEKRQC